VRSQTSMSKNKRNDNRKQFQEEINNDPSFSNEDIDSTTSQLSIKVSKFMKLTNTNFHIEQM